MDGTFVPPDFGKWGLPLWRYHEIKAFLRLNDYDNVDEKAKEEDDAWKARPVIRMMQEACRELLPNCTEFVSTDEGIIRFYGKCKFRRTIKGKPINTGMKLWIANDYLTNVTINFELDCNQYKKETYSYMPYGAKGAIILDLMGQWNGTHACVVMDNEYTSPALAKGKPSRSYHLSV